MGGRGDVTLRPHFVYLMKMPMLFVSPVGNVTYVLQIRFSVEPLNQHKYNMI